MTGLYHKNSTPCIQAHFLVRISNRNLLHARRVLCHLATSPCICHAIHFNTVRLSKLLCECSFVGVSLHLARAVWTRSCHFARSFFIKKTSRLIFLGDGFTWYFFPREMFKNHCRKVLKRMFFFLASQHSLDQRVYKAEQDQKQGDNLFQVMIFYLSTFFFYQST